MSGTDGAKVPSESAELSHGTPESSPGGAMTPCSAATSNASNTSTSTSTSTSTRRPRRFVGRRKNANSAASAGGDDKAGKGGSRGSSRGGGAAARRRTANQIPASIAENVELQKDAACLPKNYNFEIVKSVWKVKQAGATCVALQFPEGLLLYSCVISDIIEKYTDATTLVMGDVTYGACCVDDLGAKALGADFLIHYGHSCLVPISSTSVKMLYVFVDIIIDVQHLVECVRLSFDPATTRLAVMGTIQFASCFGPTRTRLLEAGFVDVVIPQARPLSSGEVLGCTSPDLGEMCAGLDAYVFVADGRFHLESVMIANPSLPAYRYDPYAKSLTTERYDIVKMKDIRR